MISSFLGILHRLLLASNALRNSSQTAKILIEEQIKDWKRRKKNKKAQSGCVHKRLRPNYWVDKLLA